MQSRRMARDLAGISREMDISRPPKIAISRLHLTLPRRTFSYRLSLIGNNVTFTLEAALRLGGRARCRRPIPRRAGPGPPAARHRGARHVHYVRPLKISLCRKLTTNRLSPLAAATPQPRHSRTRQSHSQRASSAALRRSRILPRPAGAPRCRPSDLVAVLLGHLADARVDLRPLVALSLIHI